MLPGVCFPLEPLNHCVARLARHQMFCGFLWRSIKAGIWGEVASATRGQTLQRPPGGRRDLDIRILQMLRGARKCRSWLSFRIAS